MSSPATARSEGAARARRPARNRGEREPAGTLPVARVIVDVSLPHLDRPFDYRVPAHLDEAAVPGVRVRVRFAGRMLDGYLLERVEDSAHGGRLAWVEKVVSAEPVLTPAVAGLARAVADRYAGVLADVLRLAVPARHARVESEKPRDRTIPDPQPPDRAGWEAYPRGGALLDALAGGRAAHAVWQALPREDWATRLAEAAAATRIAGRSALLVVPDQRDVDRLHTACAAVLGEDAVVALTADLGPAERYRRWLAVRRGSVRVVVGTRSGAFAPLGELGLLAVWDDGDDSHSEPRAPYPQVRDVLMLRAHREGAALLVAGFARTAEAQLLVESGWASAVVADRATVRARAPRVTAIGESDTQLVRDPAARAARVPGVAFEAARAALRAGRPVLVQVPRSGYLPFLACASCREVARCRHCAGPIGLPRPGAGGGGAARPPAGGSGPDAAGGGAGAGLPACRWCGRAEPGFRCGNCGSRRLRAGVVGAGRTAEELGRAFPGVPVRTSGGGSAVLDDVGAGPSLVVATPGAEPVAEGGYGAALLLDGWAMLARPDLRVAEETLRRWFAAAAGVVPHGDGGRVVVVAESAIPTVQALVRWDPAGHAEGELAERADVGFPPAVRMAAVEGPPAAVAEICDTVLDPDRDPPEGVELLGPVEIDPPERPGGSAAGRDEIRERALLRVPRGAGRRLAAALHDAQAVRTARKAPETVRVRLDPDEIE
ncbi:replication restart DNA helicase PriA [Pseudonocardia ammonioxydans]|uniref:Probable replication restart protein PriA n=1 Tax=Pseudonocardia ammonioxydans TaxID=260086 RepID=A0A1I5A888_PSUAM|nr:primosomal protein N' [Pseudonocardia ammonioxydans]SFN58694.1 replication restart DNA helicase PriA [Pseudonocardia ammonioxydans]